MSALSWCYWSLHVLLKHWHLTQDGSIMTVHFWPFRIYSLIYPLVITTKWPAKIETAPHLWASLETSYYQICTTKYFIAQNLLQQLVIFKNSEWTSRIRGMNFLPLLFKKAEALPLNVFESTHFYLSICAINLDR